MLLLRSRKAAKAHKNLLHIDAVEKHMRAVDVKHKPEGLSPVCACACAPGTCSRRCHTLSMYAACDSHAHLQCPAVRKHHWFQKCVWMDEGKDVYTHEELRSVLR